MLLTLVGSPQDIHFGMSRSIFCPSLLALWSHQSAAGDTAQCISKDALFRFANAKSLFYEHFRNSTSSTRELKPTLLPLSQNFRSHKQILSVASLVMHLLYRGLLFPGTLHRLFSYSSSDLGFPDLVDKLPPEIGDRPGPKPTLYGNSPTRPSLCNLANF